MPQDPPQRETIPSATPHPGVATAYVALGSNLGDREKHLKAGLAAIADLPGVTKVVSSPFYETDPVGPQDQGKFFNAAARLETTLGPEALLERLLELESQLGRPARENRQHWGPREIDLDLLLYGNAVLDQPGLTLPHPRLHERWFVLRPLCDIAADVVHPVLKQTMQELLRTVERETPAEASP